MSGPALLRDLRERGVEIEADGDVLRVRGPRDALDGATVEAMKAAKEDLLASLRREEIERVLDLTPVDPRTGLPALPADEPATARQVDRLRHLAGHPALAPHRTRVREIVEKSLDRGLSQLGAWGLLGELGRRILKQTG